MHPEAHTPWLSHGLAQLIFGLEANRVTRWVSPAFGYPFPEDASKGRTLP